MKSRILACALMGALLTPMAVAQAAPLPPSELSPPPGMAPAPGGSPPPPMGGQVGQGANGFGPTARGGSAVLSPPSVDPGMQVSPPPSAQMASPLIRPPVAPNGVAK